MCEIDPVLAKNKFEIIEIDENRYALKIKDISFLEFLFKIIFEKHKDYFEKT